MLTIGICGGAECFCDRCGKRIEKSEKYLRETNPPITGKQYRILLCNNCVDISASILDKNIIYKK
jgi:hypothetical protein